jgi:hypothetical protein
MGHIKISLRAWHTAEDLSDLSEELGVSPSLNYRAGSPRSMSDGAKPPSVHRESLWCFDMPTDALSVDEGIVQMERLLSGRKPAIEKWRARGARFEYFIGVFLDGNQTEIISASTMAGCAEKGISMVLNLYVPDQIPTGQPT